MDGAISIPARRPLRLPRLDLPPVIERELRASARRPLTYWSRVGAALAAIAVAGWWMTQFTALGLTPQVGQITFRIIAAVAALMLTSRVIRLTAEAFARERREDTLGLLFLTPLTPLDVVFGKLVSSTLGAFYDFVAVIPVLALPMLGGGVTFGDFALLVLALINLAFFCATVGLYVSAHCWDEKRAATIARITLLGFMILAPALATFFGAAAGYSRSALAYFYAVSPAYPAVTAAMVGLPLSGPFWLSMALTQIAGWQFFRATCRFLPHCRSDQVLADTEQWRARQLRQQQMAQQLAQESAWREERPASPRATRKALRRTMNPAVKMSLLERNPIAWFALRWRPQTTAIWILGAIPFVGLLAGMMSLAGNSPVLLQPEFALSICYVFNMALKTHVAAQAAFAFARDHPENSLELLLATPVTPRQLVDGQIDALSGPLRPVIGITLLVEASWLGLTGALRRDWATEENLFCIVIGVAMLALLLPDLYAVGWAALWEGAVAKDWRKAASNAQAKVLGLPWLAIIFPLPIMGILGWPFRPWWIVGVLVSWSVVADAWFMKSTPRKLERELPEAARRRAAGEVEYHAGWVRMGRWLGRLWKTR